MSKDGVLSLINNKWTLISNVEPKGLNLISKYENQINKENKGITLWSQAKIKTQLTHIYKINFLIL